MTAIPAAVAELASARSVGMIKRIIQNMYEERPARLNERMIPQAILLRAEYSGFGLG